MPIARAPVRISFAGGGTDLAAYYVRFGGCVLSAAITRYSYVVASEPAAGGGINISSADYHVWESCPPGDLPRVQEPLALPKAAIAEFAGKAGSLLRACGVDLFLASEIAPGTGLGSSSTMAAALVCGLGAYTGAPLPPPDVAELACRLEIVRLGMPIGKQDQYASAFGGLNRIEFRADGVRVTPLRLPPDHMRALSDRLLLFETGHTRSSAGILGQQRRDTESKPQVVERLHRLKVLAHAMCERLLVGDLDGFGALLDRGWQEKRRLSGKISNAAIDEAYAAARAAGALGGKITGAGGGGFLLLYCPPHRQYGVRRALGARGLRELTFDFDFTGAQVIADGGVWPEWMAGTLHGEGRQFITRRFACAYDESSPGWALALGSDLEHGATPIDTQLPEHGKGEFAPTAPWAGALDPPGRKRGS